MQAPIKRETPEFDLSWTETIIITILLCLAEWMFFVSWEEDLSNAILY